MKLLNAFSINMIEAFPCAFLFEKVSLAEVRTLFSEESLESCVGHADTAALFSSLLGISVATNRATVFLGKGEMAVVGQYRGPRLSEGVTTLPDGATVEWFLVHNAVNFTKICGENPLKAFTH